eukprot:CAMPEP_0194437366 /NCGR_PEP_ID=MMETSP0176-20130528/99624_1 /TAXON_ID=216777 /ORGANISM="Proboscia alata, Strain PI-D3" /LENGTH=599 /DNA_ID=CAMNT_0039258569 /DNA_START=65 /DNA_END=1865 /DNA_ORIENTATION=+
MTEKEDEKCQNDEKSGKSERERIIASQAPSTSDCSSEQFSPLEDLDPNFIHRALLTDDFDVQFLTISGKPRNGNTSFAKFLSNYYYSNDARSFTNSDQLEIDEDDSDTILSSMCTLPTGCVLIKTLNNCEISVINEVDRASRLSLEKRIQKTMKVAFFENIELSLMQKSREENIVIDYTPFLKLMAELHGVLRSLVPRRADLHNMLQNEEEMRNSLNAQSDLINPLLKAGRALASLEAPDRAESTMEWLNMFNIASLSPTHQNCDAAQNYDSTIQLHASLVKRFEAKSFVSLVVASAAYLLKKAEQCHEDVANIKLVQVARKVKIHAEQFERYKFQQSYGRFEETSALATKQWVEHCVLKQRNDVRDNQTCESSTEQLLKFMRTRGFIDELLFTDKKISLPETFSMDTSAFMQVREIARLSVIGSSLALHACNAAGIGTNVLNADPFPNHMWEERKILANAMVNKYQGQQVMQSGILKSVVKFSAALCGSSLSSEAEESLRNRTIAVLEGNDPVMKLLHSRVKSFFRNMCDWTENNEECLPVSMKSGRVVSGSIETSISTKVAKMNRDAFLNEAKKAACKQGLSLFAVDLAIAAVSRIG